MTTLKEHHEALPQQQYDHIIRETIRQVLRDMKAVDDKPRLEKLKCHMEMELEAQARAVFLYMVNGGLKNGGGTSLLNLQNEAIFNSCILLSGGVLEEPEFNSK